MQEKHTRQAEADRRAAQVTKKRRKKKRKSGCLLILILILAVLVGFGGYYTMGLRPVDPTSEEEVVVEIPSGSGASAIVDILDDAGLVRNKFCAKVNSRIGHYNNLQALTFSVHRCHSRRS